MDAANASLSEVNRKFLDFVERRPECLRRETFGVLDEPHPLVMFPVQSWPIFVGPERTREMHRMAVGLSRLVRGIPERLFGNDAGRIRDFSGCDEQFAAFLARTLKDRRLVGDLMIRGDYLFTADGFRCLELNAASILGGLSSSAQAPLFLDVPVIAEFLREEGVTATCRDNVHALFSMVLPETRPLASQGELNVAVVMASLERISMRWQDHFDDRWTRLLREREPAIRGRARLCAIADLEERRERLYLDDTRIHAVIEFYGESTPEHVLFPWLAGNLRLYNPPIREFLHDKRQLALLSELAGSGIFTWEEQQLIHRHVPWTRQVKAGATTYGGRRRDFDELLVAERERLVLKPSRGFGGQGVLVGRTTSEAEWLAVAEPAIADGGWVVQEWVEAPPILYQHDDACVPHDVVWGIFAFGDVPGSGFLRMAPRTGAGVVNTLQGATEGLFFEVDH